MWSSFGCGEINMIRLLKWVFLVLSLGWAAYTTYLVWALSPLANLSKVFPGSSPVPVTPDPLYAEIFHKFIAVGYFYGPFVIAIVLFLVKRPEKIRNEILS